MKANSGVVEMMVNNTKEAVAAVSRIVGYVGRYAR